MKTVEELGLAVEALPSEEYRRFRRWFLDRDAERWDEEIEADSSAGRLDSLLREAAQAKKDKRLRDL